MNLILLYAVEIAIFEFSLVLALLLLTFLLRVYFEFADRRLQTITKKITFIFLKLLRNHAHFEVSLFPNNLKQLDPLLKVIEIFDTEHNSAAWEALRLEIIIKLLLPIARNAVKSGHTLNTIYATEVFTMYAEPQDEGLLETITYEQSPLAYLNASRAGIIFGFKNIILNFIDRLAAASWLYQTAISYVFYQGSSKAKLIVTEKLQHANNPKVKATCYDILLHFPPTPSGIDILNDIASSHLDLKLAAIKYLAYADRDAAIPVLISLLSDHHKEVRLVAIHRLYTLKAATAITALSVCLQDPEWTVKISAAKALNYLSDQGIEIIKNLAPELNIYLAKLPYAEGSRW